MFKNKDAIAGTPAKSQEDMGVDSIKPITMNETGWKSRYEMTKRVIKLKHHIDNTIDHFTANLNLLNKYVPQKLVYSMKVEFGQLDPLALHSQHREQISCHDDVLEQEPIWFKLQRDDNDRFENLNIPFNTGLVDWH
ncbi:hypothetical protein BGZ99_007170 [Dissophora globulifera]|uniref:Uncharacterized protein n=1 Tax=Dissophora globulifera TaxID=979702 RepID=A0A9P6RE87_9FUNG|nr:hypothetical protein BGZ99_007170 [Dissophora globulifera]